LKIGTFAAPAGARSKNRPLSAFQYRGTMRHEAEELIWATNPSGAPRVGRKLNVTGGQAGWATMGAGIQQVTEDVFSGTTTVTFGPPEHLGPQDLLSLSMLNRRRPVPPKEQQWQFDGEKNDEDAGGTGASREVTLCNPTETVRIRSSRSMAQWLLGIPKSGGADRCCTCPETPTACFHCDPLCTVLVENSTCSNAKEKCGFGALDGSNNRYRSQLLEGTASFSETSDLCDSIVAVSAVHAEYFRDGPADGCPTQVCMSINGSVSETVAGTNHATTSLFFGNALCDCVDDVQGAASVPLGICYSWAITGGHPLIWGAGDCRGGLSGWSVVGGDGVATKSWSRSCSYTGAKPPCGNAIQSGADTFDVTLSDEITTDDLRESVACTAVLADVPVGGFPAALFCLSEDELEASYTAAAYRFKKGPAFVAPHATVTWDVVTYSTTGSGCDPASEISRVPHSAVDPWTTVYFLTPDPNGDNVVMTIENVAIVCTYE
jgi:hypothetical protein